MSAAVAGMLVAGFLALVASVALLTAYRVERFVGTRYLRRSTTVRSLRLAPLVALAVTAVGFILLLATRQTHRAIETVAVVLALGGLLAAILFLLLRFFSVFTTVSTVGVMLGVASLVVVLSVTSGFEREFQDKVQAVNAHLIVTSYGIERDVEETDREADSVRQRLAGMPGLLRMSRFSFTAGEVMIGKIGANLKGVELSDGVPELRRAMVAGSLDDLARPATCSTLPGRPAGEPSPASTPTSIPPTPTTPATMTNMTGRIVLGAELAHRVHAAVGDCIQVLVPFSGGFESVPSAYRFRVVGISSFGFQEYDARLAFIPLEDAKRLGNARQSIFGVELRFTSAMQALAAESKVEERLGSEMRVIDWKTLNKNLFTALAMQKLIISLLLVLIIVVAAFNILASLTLVVLSKVREVAIIASMGARAGTLLRIFLVSGGVVGFVGTGWGIIYGLALCGLASLYGYPLDPKVYLIAKLPVEVSGTEILLVAGATQIICLLATLYPAWRASRQQVVEGLKYV
ncbi:MAG: FtsX-like permease family protein [Polyangia bacterium]|jgi:lipoprotein-releasing system permease protein